MTSKEIANIAVKALDDKLGENICLLEIEKVTVVADYFIIVNGNSNTHVKALADEVEYALSQKGEEPIHVEGRATGWILIDYGCVIVHIFTPEAREYYNLEKLWNDGEVVDIATLVED